MVYLFSEIGINTLSIFLNLNDIDFKPDMRPNVTFMEYNQHGLY